MRAGEIVRLWSHDRVSLILSRAVSITISGPQAPTTTHARRSTMTTESQTHSAPTFVTLPPTADECSATVVLLHGLGDTPQGILRLARMLRSRGGLNHVQFVVPVA